MRKLIRFSLTPCGTMRLVNVTVDPGTLQSGSYLKVFIYKLCIFLSINKGVFNQLQFISMIDS